MTTKDNTSDLNQQEWKHSEDEQTVQEEADQSKGSEAEAAKEGDSTPAEDQPQDETAPVGKAEEPKAEEEKEDGDTKYLRLAADFQNFKRRVEKEKRISTLMRMKKSRSIL